jgi:fructokinase
VAEPIVLGVDVGGTKIEVVAARAPDGERLVEIARRRFPTGSDEGYEAVIARTAAAIRETASDAAVDPATAALGIGMPGGVTRRGGLVKNSNTVCLNGRPFRDDLRRQLGRDAVFDNDANCFALAETWLGAAAPFRASVVFGVIMGTGVGSGVVLGGEVWSGAHGIAGEWGHHGVWARAADARACYCGQSGCLERYLAGPAVEEDYAARSGRRAPLVEIARLRASDAHAEAALQAFCDTFGRALANVIAILDPAVVVLGGGVSNLDLLYDEGRARVAHYVFNDELTVPILRHALGDSAGVLGAALLALRDRRAP